MIRAIPYNQDPSEVRTFMQTRYDDYMAGRRLRLGITLPGVQLDSMGITPDERESAYQAYVERFSRKSRGLFRNIARESLFEQSCVVTHQQTVDFWHNTLAIGNPGSEYATLVIGGMGRNAVWSSLVSQEGLVDRRLSFSSPESLPQELIEQANLGLVVDIDTGMGNIRGMKTPEMAGIRAIADQAA